MRSGHYWNLHTHVAKCLLLHPFNVRNSHGSDIIVAVIFRIIREGLGVTAAPNPVSGFQNIDVGDSHVFEHHCNVETSYTSSNNVHATLKKAVNLDAVWNFWRFGECVAVRNRNFIVFSKKMLV